MRSPFPSPPPTGRDGFPGWLEGADGDAHTSSGPVGPGRVDASETLAEMTGSGPTVPIRRTDACVALCRCAIALALTPPRELGIGKHCLEASSQGNQTTGKRPKPTHCYLVKRDKPLRTPVFPSCEARAGMFSEMFSIKRRLRQGHHR